VTEAVCADVQSDANGSSSGPSSPPSAQQWSSLVRALEAQTAALDNLAKSVLALSVAAEQSANTCMLVLDSLSEQADDEEEGGHRDMLGRRIEG
jgi:hypothetical protein